MTGAGTALRQARDFLIATRLDHARASREFRWPRLDEFNFALDWFDTINPAREALRIVSGDRRITRTYGELSEASNRAANMLREAGLRRGDPVILMLGNVEPLWIILLAAMKLGLVIVPTSTLVSADDLSDRIIRSKARLVVADGSRAPTLLETEYDGLVLGVGAPVGGWLSFDDHAECPATFTPDGSTCGSDPLLLYFTSGTTARPKMVLHSHASYPVGHLSTLYWMGLQPGDVHLNISSPGWAKHAWSSIFAPWLAEATVMILDQPRFSAAMTLDVLARERVTSFCAPPTVWRMLVQEDLTAWAVSLREALAAGEPLNPEIIDQVRHAWDLPIRDGYGQTETTAQIGNTPGQPLEVGAMGRPLPGYRVVLLDADDREVDEGEIGLVLGGDRPVSLMLGYLTDKGVERIEGAVYRTGDIARRDAKGIFTYVGRADDLFKASDYRISPFELESVLIKHAAVAEAAVVASPHPTRLAVPKAFVALAPGERADADTARAILHHAGALLGPYKRIRRIEFCELPKTVSGKIRRVDLREQERARRAADRREPLEWFEEDFAD